MAEATMVRLPYEKLMAFGKAVLTRRGITAEDAEIIVRTLLVADTFGFKTHGIRRLRLEYEELGPDAHTLHPQIRVVRETPACALLDGDNGAGPLIATRAMELAIKKAKEIGVGVVVARNTNSLGAASAYSSMALEQKLIGFCCCNFTGTVVAPPFSTKSLLGTNPLSLAVPAGKELPYLLDMATAVVAGNRLRPFKESGQPIPWGWAQDKEGNVVTDVKKMMSILPLGSTPELGSFKGYGLGLGVDIMSAVLGGGYYGNLKLRQGKRDEKKNTATHFMAALDPGRFRPLEEFLAAMDEMIQNIHQTPPTPGAQRVPVVGEREMENHREAQKRGVPLEPRVVEELRVLGQEVGVAADF
jgi:LDH2 family malate/lactate/ureidoglycolate dehydrogenase